MPPRAWQKAEAITSRPRPAMATVQGQIRALAEESSQLQRVRRVVPLLTQLGEARESLATPPVRRICRPMPKASSMCSVAAQRGADRDGERERTEVQRLVAAARAALPGDAAVIALQDARIDALHIATCCQW